MPKSVKKNNIAKQSKWKSLRDMLRQAKILEKNEPKKIDNGLKKVMTKYNTTTYRTKYKRKQLHLNSFVRSGGLLNKDKYFLMNTDSRKMFDQFKIISSPKSSASDSVVVALIRGNQQFIMKLTLDLFELF